MGCGNSKDVAERIEKQEKKIDELIKTNTVLETKFKELLQSMNNNPGRASDNNPDLSNLKSMIDTRFNNLESRIRRIHNDFRLKLFDGIEGNFNSEREFEFQKNGSMSLPSIHDAEKEKGDAQNAHWNDILDGESPSNKRAQKRTRDQRLSGVRNSVESKRRNERLDSQESYKESSGSKLAKVQDDIETDPKGKGQEVHERLGDGEQLAKANFLIMGTTTKSVVKKSLEPSSSQFKQQYMESIKSKELGTEVLDHNGIKMNLGDSAARLKAAEGTVQSKKSVHSINATELIPEKGKDIYNDIMSKMFKNSPKP